MHCQYEYAASLENNSALQQEDTGRGSIIVHDICGLFIQLPQS